MISNHKFSAGFTMIEMTISIVIIAIISGLALTLFSEATENYFNSTNSKHLIGDSQKSFWKIAQEIRGIESKEGITSSTDTKFYTNSDPQGLNIELSSTKYVYINKNESEHILSDKLDPSVENVFHYLDNRNIPIEFSESLTESQARSLSSIQIEMQLKSKNDVVHLETHVTPRNFRYGSKMSYHEY